MSMAERKTMTRAVKNPVKRKLTRAEKKEIAAVIQAAKGDGKPRTAQQTIPYLQMYPDGICRVTEKKYSKSLVFEDINYQLAQADDKTAIFENWCDFLNYFDASVSVQLSFINQGARKEKAQAAIEIPAQDDAFNSIRREYADTPAMVDKMFQQIIDKGLKPSTAAGAKRVLSVALSHARKYRYIETNAAKDTLTKFGKSDKTPDPYTPEQVKALMQRVEGTVWEMPVILGGLYGMRRSEILGLRWRNVDLENNTFDVSEQLPFKVPPKTKVIEEMAPPKSNGRTLPITELARPFFLKQFAMQEAQREQAEKDGKPYYDNDLVVAKPDGSPISASWVSSQFGKLLEDLDMPHIRFHDLRHTAATNMHQLTGDFYTVGEVLGHTLAGIGVSLGLSMNFEAVTARYVDVRLERKKEVLDAYHGAVKQADPAKAKEAEPKKAKSAAKKKSSEIEL